jgi:hypothetical protein
LRTRLQLTTSIPAKFRQEFAKKCIIYLTRFCCNILR